MMALSRYSAIASSESGSHKLLLRKDRIYVGNCNQYRMYDHKGGSLLITKLVLPPWSAQPLNIKDLLSSFDSTVYIIKYLLLPINFD